MKPVDPIAAREGALAAKSLIELQFYTHKALLERADGTTRLAVALLGGITLITGYTLTEGLLETVSASLILLSVLIALSGIFSSLRVSVGTFARRVLELGPNLWTVQRSVYFGQTRTEAHLSLIAAYRKAYETNRLTINRRSRLLVVTSYLLVPSTTLFLAALIYILGSVIYG